MKNQNLNPLSLFSKPLNGQLQLLKLLSYFLLFGGGLTLGLILGLLCQKEYSSFPLQSSTPPPQSSFSATTSNMSHTRIGLKEYLKPPKVWHDMDDVELLWRASVTPRIPEYPFHRVPKVAFMFLTKGPVLLAPLWDNFFKGHQGLYSIYVHSNPPYNASSHPESPVFHGRGIPSKKVEWGYTNMIEAESRLLANALLDISNQRFVLLSESCIPLYNFSTIYSYLLNSNQTFVQVYDDPGPVGRGRYSDSYGPQISLAQWRKGSQWFEMDRDLAIEVVSDRKYYPVFQNLCRGYCFADEHYLPTYVNIKFGERNSNRSLTWVDWSKGGPHPYEFMSPNVTVGLLNSMRSGYGAGCVYNGRRTDVCFLFARKFPPATLDSLLRIVHFN